MGAGEGGRGDRWGNHQGICADSNQQVVSVTMVTRQKYDVIVFTICGIFGGKGSALFDCLSPPELM